MDCVQFSHCARVKNTNGQIPNTVFQVCAEPLYPQLLLQGWERKIFRKYPAYREKESKEKDKDVQMRNLQIYLQSRGRRPRQWDGSRETFLMICWMIRDTLYAPPGRRSLKRYCKGG